MLPRSTILKKYCFWLFANEPVPVTTNTNTGRFKTSTQDTYRYSDIYLSISDVLTDSFLCIEKLKKTLVYEFYLQI